MIRKLWRWIRRQDEIDSLRSRLESAEHEYKRVCDAVRQFVDESKEEPLALGGVYLILIERWFPWL